MKKKIIIIMILVFLFSAIIVNAKDLLIRIIEIDGELEILSMNVISQNPYYSNYYLDYKEEESDYKIILKDEENIVVYDAYLQGLGFTLINYNKINVSRKLLVSKGEKVLYNFSTNFCNDNGICESCFGTNCTDYENELICSDCNTNSKDNYCNIQDDKVCDFDCVPFYEYDVPNIYEGCFEDEFSKKTCEDYGLFSCGENQVCFGEEYYLAETNKTCCLEDSCVDEIIFQPTAKETKSGKMSGMDYSSIWKVVIVIIIGLVFFVVYILKKKKIITLNYEK